MKRLCLYEKGSGGEELRRITHFLELVYCSESKQNIMVFIEMISDAPYHLNNRCKLCWTQPAVQFLKLQPWTLQWRKCVHLAAKREFQNGPYNFSLIRNLPKCTAVDWNYPFFHIYTWREVLIIFADYINHLVFLVLLKWVIMYVMCNKRDEWSPCRICYSTFWL
jgi:hypothetical protein